MAVFSWKRSTRIIEMVRGIPKGVELQFLQMFLRNLAHKPINDQTCRYASLAVGNKNQFVAIAVPQRTFDLFVRIPNVLRRIAEIPLNEAFDEIENNPPSV